MEELEAVDWYDQRFDASDDPELAAVLAHNRDEEKEHAAMTLEWLRRNDPVLDQNLRTYLFTTDSIVGEEHAAEHGDADEPDPHDDTPPTDAPPAHPSSDGSLGIGSLREDTP
jgi:ferritin-like protein